MDTWTERLEDWHNPAGLDATIIVYRRRWFAELVVIFIPTIRGQATYKRRSWFTWAWHTEDCLPFGRQIVAEWRRNVLHAMKG